MNKLEIKHKQTNEIIMTIEYKNSISGADLRGANLRGANLSEADLRGANLRGANLSGADLSWANLSEADLREADLGGANLRRADLGGANLRGANLWRADLSGANLSEADLGGANLRRADLGGANLSEAKNINYDNLIGSNIYNVKIKTDDIFIEILGYKYTAYIFKDYMQIGCKKYNHSEWLRFWKIKKLDDYSFNEYFSKEQLEMIYTCVKKQNDKLKKEVKDNE